MKPTPDQIRRIEQLLEEARGMGELERWMRDPRVKNKPTRKRGPSYWADPYLLRLAETLQQVWRIRYGRDLTTHAAVTKVVDLCWHPSLNSHKPGTVKRVFSKKDDPEQPTTAAGGREGPLLLLHTLSEYGRRRPDMMGAPWGPLETLHRQCPDLRLLPADAEKVPPT